MTIASPVSRLGALLLDLVVPVACLIVAVLGFSSGAVASGGAPDLNAAPLGAALLILVFARFGYFIWALAFMAPANLPVSFLWGFAWCAWTKERLLDSAPCSFVRWSPNR